MSYPALRDRGNRREVALLRGPTGSCRRGLRDVLPRSVLFILFLLATVSVFRTSVVCAQAGDSTPAGVNEGRRDGSDAVLLLIPQKTTAYLHERMLLTVTFLYRGSVLRDIRYPDIAHEGFTLSALQDPIRSTESWNNDLYTSLQFRALMTPNRVGRLALGPATLTYSSETAGSNPATDYFGTRQKRTIRLVSPPVMLNVLPLPSAGAHRDFSGAVGRFDAAVSVQPSAVRPGEPVTLRLDISGNGDAAFITCPSVAPEGFKTFDPVSLETPSGRACEYILIPQSASASVIPAIRFRYFDPETATYALLSRGPFSVRVEQPDALSEGGDGRTSGRDKRRERSGGDVLPDRVSRSLAAAITAFAVLLLLAVATKRRIIAALGRCRRQVAAKRRLHEGIVRARSALQQNNVQEFYATMFKSLQRYIGDTCELPYEGITVEVVDRVLQPRGLNETALEEIRELFEACDKARYQPGAPDRASMEAAAAGAGRLPRLLSARTSWRPVAGCRTRR